MRAAFLALPLLALGILVVPARDAHASAGFSCEADDASLTLALSGAYGHSIGSGIVNFGGTATIKLAGVPDAARKPAFTAEHLTQSWLEDGDFRLAVRWQTEGSTPSAEVVLLVTTHRGPSEDAPYRGRYRLLVFAGDSGGLYKARGRITCSVE